MSIPENRPRPGELWLKEWLAVKATADNVCIATVFKRYRKGEYSDIQIRQVNPRVIFVSVRRAGIKKPGPREQARGVKMLAD